MGKQFDRVMESRKELTNFLIKEMEKGELPWHKDWKVCSRPYNPLTKTVYQGGNRIRLMLAARMNGFKDPRWMTFKQAADKNWKIKKGSKGILCEKWIYGKMQEVEDPETHEKKMEFIPYANPTVNSFWLFNGEQIEGIQELDIRKPLPKTAQLELADRFVKSSVCPVIEEEMGSECYYTKLFDEIHLPSRNQFESAESFLSSAIHEMGHSTGHPSRLNRDMSGEFGSDKYSREELVAELSAVYVQADLGIDLGDHIENHAAYLQYWIKNLKENPNILFQVSKDASKASEFLMNKYEQYLNKEKVQQQTQEIHETEENTVENIQNGETEKMKKDYVVTYVNDGISQIMIVQAKDRDQAEDYFLDQRKDSTVLGVSEDHVGYLEHGNPRGVPVMEVPDEWHKEPEEEKNHDDDFEM